MHVLYLEFNTVSNSLVMKYLFPLLMAVVIFAGVLLSSTPFIMEYFFPLPKQSIQQATPEAAEIALKRWFNAPNADFNHVQAMRERLADIGTNSYFSFETDAETVKQFIRLKRLQQLELTDEVMKNLFTQADIPWWQPETLTRKSYFSGDDKGILLHLIYNAELKRGFLLLQQ